MSTSSINCNIQDNDLQCKFVLRNKSNCARRMAVKYDGLCKYHFETLSQKEQEEALLNGNKRLQEQARARREAFLANKAKLAENLLKQRKQP